MDSKIVKMYGNQVRVRVCGLCWDGENLLMVNHKGMHNGPFWAPPGGGVEFEESMENGLKREFLEETGLIVDVGAFLFGCEIIRSPLHSVELFYHVKRVGGDLVKGGDPELQIIEDVRFLDSHTRAKFNPNDIHGIFRLANSSAEFANLNGFYSL
jgi:8-oxo-dGTP diphosphatase